MRPVRAEIGRIVAASFKDGQLTISQDDKSYIASQIAQRTGISQQDAEKRIDTVVDQAKTAISDAQTKAKQAADDARKAGAGVALWTFVALLLGAFCASFMATIGGRHRDNM
jgi:Flp pilus assembly protein TadB